MTAIFASVLVSCDNPADQTTDAKVGEVQEAAMASAEAVKYTFSPDSSIKFIGSKALGESHAGGFKTFNGEFKVLDGIPVSGSFTIDMDSIYSDDERLTGHLKNEDFFNVPENPESKFVVTGFEQASDTSYTVSGNLTMAGKTHNVSFPAEVTEGGDQVSLTADFDLNRKDWGIEYPGKPDNLIRDEVVIELRLNARAQK